MANEIPPAEKQLLQALALMRDEFQRLTAERDQYKQIAELNAETIHQMKEAEREQQELLKDLQL